LHHLSDAQDAGEEIDLPYTNNVIDSILSLLGEDNNITREYRQQFVPESAGINSK